ncbi:restriction system protein [Gammaproteobacteria bacterium]
MAIQLGLQHHIESVFKIRPAIVNGSTKTTTTKRGGHSRQSIIDDFQTVHGFNVIILGTTAIGFGVNIVGANHVIHYTRAWNPAKEDQATDRAYRIGQTRPVRVYYPTVTSPNFVTFEAKLDFLLDSKRNLSEDILNGIPGLTMDDWEDLQTAEGNPAYSPIRVLPEHLKRIDGRAFERLCLRLWQQQGYTDVYSTPGSGDGGVDVVAIDRDTGRGCLIQCKTSTDHRPMGWDAVKDVVTGAAAYEYRHPQVSFQKIAVTNQHFGPTAHQQAQINAVELLEQNDLFQLLERYEIIL